MRTEAAEYDGLLRSLVSDGELLRQGVRLLNSLSQAVSPQFKVGAFWGHSGQVLRLWGRTWIGIPRRESRLGQVWVLAYCWARCTVKSSYELAEICSSMVGELAAAHLLAEMYDTLPVAKHYLSSLDAFEPQSLATLPVQSRGRVALYVSARLGFPDALPDLIKRVAEDRSLGGHFAVHDEVSAAFESETWPYSLKLLRSMRATTARELR